MSDWEAARDDTEYRTRVSTRRVETEYHYTDKSWESLMENVTKFLRTLGAPRYMDSYVSVHFEHIPSPEPRGFPTYDCVIEVVDKRAI